MKSHSLGIKIGIISVVSVLVISILCTIDKNYLFKDNSKNTDSLKVADSVQDAVSNKDEEVYVDSTQVLSSVSHGEIVKGTAKEIAAKQEQAMKEAEKKALEEEARKKVYDNLTLDELSDKIDRMFKKSYLKGKGRLFASYSLELGVDPYTAVAIALLETGCEWNCSAQVRTCNNVGGMKGGPSCNGTSYKSFSTLDDGIKKFIENLSYNYYKKGLDTPEKMNHKYAASTTWAMKVNKYIAKIRKV